MNRFFHTNGVYLSAWLAAFLVIVCVLVLGPDKGDLHLALNGCHTPFGDAFFRYYTLLAQWPLYVIMAFLLLYRYSWTIYYALSEVLSACVVQVIKLFVNLPRPAAFFGDDAAFQQIVVDGVHLHQWHSFPSGHTATFFVFFTVLAFLIATFPCSRQGISQGEKKAPRNMHTPSRQNFVTYIAVILCLVLALLGGYSRIYLSQHFLLDVTVGMLIGTLAPCVLWPVFLRLDAKPALHKRD